MRFFISFSFLLQTFCQFILKKCETYFVKHCPTRQIFSIFVPIDARPRSPTLQAPTVRRHLPTFPFPAVPPFTSLRRTGGELMTKHTQQLRVTRRPLGLSVPLSSALSSSLIPPFPVDLRLQAYRISKFKCPQGVCAIYVRPTNPARLEAIYSYCANEYVKILRHIARLLFLISTTRCKLRVKSQ